MADTQGASKSDNLIDLGDEPAVAEEPTAESSQQAVEPAQVTEDPLAALHDVAELAPADEPAAIHQEEDTVGPLEVQSSEQLDQPAAGADQPPEEPPEPHETVSAAAPAVTADLLGEPAAVATAPPPAPAGTGDLLEPAVAAPAAQLESAPQQEQQPVEEDPPFDPLTAAAREAPAVLAEEKPGPAADKPAAAAPLAGAAAAGGLAGPQDQLTVRRYLDGTVVPVLRGAMRELCVQRPADPFQFLADYILEHRPK